jgi:two-component system, chemotaxis family, CheB/CheR fusion protein
MTDDRERDDSERVEELLQYLKKTRGFDFTAYKRSSLVRRIEKRLQVIGASSYEEYQGYLENHPEEFGLLFNNILINVTNFFRDSEAWRFVAAEVVPRILSDAQPEGAIRVWSAGCASGEEAYTLAMILVEHLGMDQFRHRVKIYASDVDDEALTQARHATYSAQHVQDIPPELLKRYFDRIDDRYVFNKDLRRAIIFGRHDLVQDAPIARVHLLVCRNTLMYFTRETQAKILGRFHFSLRNGGYLFMGRAELLLTHGDLFTPVDLKSRVFSKTLNQAREHLGLLQREEATVGTPSDNHLQALTLESDNVGRVVFRADGTLALANAQARRFFRLTAQDLGKRLQDLELSYRPVELRSLVHEAVTHNRRVSRQNIPWPSGDGDAPRYLELEIEPLTDGGSGHSIGVHVSFADVTRYRTLQEELERSKHELETAYEDLQSTNEELETTNEELQSTNEELETTNEELQSTNEELETMNEELQSTNEELETTNTELRLRSDELNHANAFLASILTGLEFGVVVVDPRVQVLAWNHRAEDMWGLRANEVQGRHLMNLDIGLPVEQLNQPIRSVLLQDAAHVEVSLDSVNRRGRSIRCHVRANPLLAQSGEILGVILLMEERAAEPPRSS